MWMGPPAVTTKNTKITKQTDLVFVSFVPFVVKDATTEEASQAAATGTAIA
jgi:hypothetical protein